MLDTLKADGISVLSSYGYEMVARRPPRSVPCGKNSTARKAVVYSHATTPDCCRTVMPNFDPTTIEFNTDTAPHDHQPQIESRHRRQRYPGYSLRVLARRRNGSPALRRTVPQKAQATSSVLEGQRFQPTPRLGHHLRRFFYDTAWASANIVNMQSLKLIVLPSQSGTRYRLPVVHAGGHSRRSQADAGLTPEELRGIERDNASAPAPAIRQDARLKGALPPGEVTRQPSFFRRGTTVSNAAMSEQIAKKPGFLAALDQSGGSTPGALKGYGIPETAYSGDAEMFKLMHEMRVRIISAPAFTGDKVIAAILFEGTMDGQAGGKIRTQACSLWERPRCGSVSENRQGTRSRKRRRPADETDRRARRAARARGAAGRLRHEDAFGHQPR